MSQDDDAALLLAFRGGDEAAFRLLYERNARAMIAFCHRFVRDAARAEELAQDVFVKLYRSADRYRPEARFKTFLYRVATNHCLNEVRRAEFTARAAGGGDEPADLDALPSRPPARTTRRWRARWSWRWWGCSGRCRRSSGRPSCSAASRG